ncbi:hypothetical protein [Fictibacillus barbaricus]|uniref:Uncharacterized protein n=1 Tax=Fictibacillus barbaricus TaxID=182136 RepID=A0ABU1TXT6_9BACL|nr:hypothetical protein [Fictibacillus barbaricus]MDR7072032.1 hypothetical protein [Fictibacillus barbaricus]
MMMPLRLNVQSTAWENNTLVLNVPLQESKGIMEWKDSERMLVDSDGLSFIYVLENSEGFIYIAIDNNHWEDLREAISNSSDVWIQNDTGEKLKLSSFNKEMEYLTENIKGNANYGQQMEDEVMKIFGTEENAG